MGLLHSLLLHLLVNNLGPQTAFCGGLGYGVIAQNCFSSGPPIYAFQALHFCEMLTLQNHYDQNICLILLRTTCQIGNAGLGGLPVPNGPGGNNNNNKLALPMLQQGQDAVSLWD